MIFGYTRNQYYITLKTFLIRKIMDNNILNNNKSSAKFLAIHMDLSLKKISSPFWEQYFQYLIK